ncbi:MAG: protein kinase [Phycisphaera sp.]|nr:protein kinase [Phycisphaera sp.]
MSHPDKIVGFEVLTVLGYGAHSTIYAARDDKSGQVFAMKRVTLDTPDDKRFLQQAMIEFDVGRKLDHPTLRKCFKIKKQRLLWKVTEVVVTMEYVEGHTLVHKRPPSLRKMIDVFIEVATGLQAMHRDRIVHGDMKPNNIIVTDAGEVKIIDYGHACPFGTIKERVQGTPDYIAPEQVQRKALDARTDVFNFGASMYWCVTDKHVPTMLPAQPNAIMLKKEVALQPPNEINPDVPIALNNLIMECVANDPAKRPVSMNAVRERLQMSQRQTDAAHQTVRARG